MTRNDMIEYILRKLEKMNDKSIRIVFFFVQRF